MRSRGGFAVTKMKKCMRTPVGGSQSPLVYFHVARAPRSASGYGVLVSKNWALTCEHVAAKSDPAYLANRVGSPVGHSRRALAVVLQRSSSVYFPDRFAKTDHDFKYSIGSENECLALVRLEPTERERPLARVDFVEPRGRFESVQFGAISLNEADGLSCAVVGVDALELRRVKGTNNYLTTEFCNPAQLQIRRGDSGGIFFDGGRTDGTVGLVGISNAQLGGINRAREG